MDISIIRDVCSRYNDSGSDYFTDPIPNKKATNARKSLNIPSIEKIVALIDFTVFGSAKDAMVVTESGLYWKQLLQEPIFLPWEKLRQFTISEEKSEGQKSISFDNDLKMSLSGAESLVQEDKNIVLQLLNDLKEIAYKVEVDEVAQSSVLSGGMNLSTLRDICSRYNGCAKEYNIEPIPEKKERNARGSLKVPDSEKIIALIDFTSFGSAKDAMVVTESGLYWKNGMDQTVKVLSWDQLVQSTPSQEPGILWQSIDFGTGLKMDLGGASTLQRNDNHSVLHLLKDLKTLAEGGIVNDQASNNSEGLDSDLGKLDNGLNLCEFCHGKVKPEVTYCKHCGIKLRG